MEVLTCDPQLFEKELADRLDKVSREMVAL